MLPRLPAEWQTHRSCWLAWPTDKTEWGPELQTVQETFVALCYAIADFDKSTHTHRGELLEILVTNPQDEQLVHKRLRGLQFRTHKISYDDIWLRDTAPLFVSTKIGTSAVCPRFNGWGNKFRCSKDQRVSHQIAKAIGAPIVSAPWILEGGSIDVDGQGTAITTRQCLLHNNRNPSLNKQALENSIGRALGIHVFIWLSHGLQQDHTDGHVDTLARFVRPGVVVCMTPNPAGDPNHQALLDIAATLEQSYDARGEKLQVLRIPSPGSVKQRGTLLPASYLNFYIANRTVIVPTYGKDTDKEAVTMIAQQFPQRQTIGLNAQSLLTGGGTFHCITQPQFSNTVPYK